MGWTFRDIPDLRGRTAVVTGANGGLGYVIARELARRGAHVVLACRSRPRGQAALERLLEEVPEARAELRPVDLADLSSVRAFAAEWPDRPLDLLVNNAGQTAVPYGRTADGFETQFGVNHLGHFALTCLLGPWLLLRPGARVVTVASLAHLLGNVDLRDPHFEHGYRRWVAFGRSKTANLLFTHELARRTRARGLVAAAVHPGYAEGGPEARRAWPVRPAARVLARLVAAPPELGAAPALYAATAPRIAPGSFTGPSAVTRTVRGGPGGAWRAPWTRDDATAARLWQLSERLTGARWP
ncbi:oxidoreductase [Streptomyces hoynatensis]|uniref:SDR family NAD(P)-dependent oxidoreductase n=1 Tax=Streptomyces hoynatensis TaxID=1141874 RepID=A0A3A9ZBX8_9ACTN|nr:oxidoreductase [Streptomyces hoynatensis]RKN45695.1 SDR family NAD(P)-dependent oxidoreductase [Streptomyces hoynatensis]